MRDQAITLSAVLNRIATTADGGWRIAFDTGANEAESLSQLAKLRDQELALVVMPAEVVRAGSDDLADLPPDPGGL